MSQFDGSEGEIQERGFLFWFHRGRERVVHHHCNSDFFFACKAVQVAEHVLLDVDPGGGQRLGVNHIGALESVFRSDKMRMGGVLFAHMDLYRSRMDRAWYLVASSLGFKVVRLCAH